jgi:hypothetical protein
VIIRAVNMDNVDMVLPNIVMRVGYGRGIFHGLFTTGSDGTFTLTKVPLGTWVDACPKHYGYGYSSVQVRAATTYTLRISVALDYPTDYPNAACLN